MQSGILELPSILPQKSGRVALPSDLFKQESEHETWLTVTFRLNTATAWADTGYPVTFCQAQLSSTASPSVPNHVSVSKPLSVNVSQLHVRVCGSNFSFAFDLSRGQIVEWMLSGKTVLQADGSSASPLLGLDFWRAPTDNDAASLTKEWKSYGLNVMTFQLRTFAFN